MPPSPVLTVEHLQQIAMDCLFEATENWQEAPSIPGLITEYKFHPSRLAARAPAIRALLAELPVTFRRTAEGGGGGWSFLNACEDQAGRQWGEHHHMETLICLGIAIGAAQWMPKQRDVWPAMPGGVPYVELTLAAPPQ